MKFRIIIIKIILAVFAVQVAFSQTENVGIGTTAPDNSALLHLDVSAMATKRGLLIPKVTSAQRTGISNPANGLLVYDTDDNRFYYNAGTPATPNWVAFVATNSTFPFSSISSGTNTTAAMVVGNGASLAPTGTGYIQANRFVGVASTTDAVDLATSEVNGILPIANGGTGLSTTPTNGQLLIGNGTGYTLNTLTAGTGVSITNGSGTITLSADAANISHNSLNNLQLAQAGVTYGHIDDQAQTIAGAKTFSSNVTAPTFTSTVNTGTAPFTVNSTTLVNNLNADLLDGLNSTDFLQTTSTGNLTTTTTGVTITGGANSVIGTGTTINIATADGSTTGLLSSSDWNTFNNKLGAGSAAGGDLSGTYPNPTVDGLQGYAVSNTAPTNGQVLKWNGTAWTPSTDDNTAYTAGNGIDITGTTISVDFAGSGTANTVARSDHNHTGVYEPVLTKGDLTTTTTGVTITGGANSVIGSGTTINIATADGSTTGLLTSTDWSTFNNKLGSGSAAGGDLSGTYPNPTVDGLQGYAVSNTAPSNGQVLKWNGTAWEPGTDNNASYTAGNGIDITGTTISADFAGSGTANTVARSDHNHTGVYEPVLTKGDLTTTTTGVTITGGANSVIGSGTTINIATADGSTTGILTSSDWTTFNNKLGAGSAAGGDLSGTYPNPTVDGLQGYAVSNTAPSSGQVLKWNGSAWEPGTDETSGLSAGNGIDITGSTISVIFAGSGTANTAARSDHNHDGTYEEALTFSSPLTRTGNTISIPQANSSTNGYLSSTDWGTFNNKLSSSLTDSYIFVGNGSDVATAVALSGDASIINTGEITVTGLQGRDVSNTAPTNGQVLTWNNTLSQWEPQSPGGSTGWTLTGNTLTGTEFLGSTNNQPLVVYTNNAERLRVSASGNLGLGYDDPKVILHQDQGDATATYHKFTAGTTTGQSATDGFDVGIDASGNAILNQRENLNLQISTNNTERMRILNNGKVLIGTTTAPDDSVLVRINGDLLIDKDLIVEGNIDPEAIIFKQIPDSIGNPKEGMVYYNSTEKKLKVHDGSSFQDITGGPVVVRAYLSSDGSINNTSWTNLIFNSESYDTHNAFSSGTFTAPEDGFYKVNAQLYLSTSSYSNTNYYEFQILKNGSTFAYNKFQYGSALTFHFHMSIDEIVYLQKNDVISLEVRKYTGSPNATIKGGTENSHITIHLIK